MRGCGDGVRDMDGMVLRGQKYDFLGSLCKRNQKIYSDYRVKKIGTNKLLLHGKIYTKYNGLSEGLCH